jgi:hypothetical protein
VAADNFVTAKTIPKVQPLILSAEYFELYVLRKKFHLFTTAKIYIATSRVNQ